MSELRLLSNMIIKRNTINKEISKLINRPALPRHIGEFIASKIFDINLAASATTKGIDGYFSKGSLKGRTVNIKLYGKREGILDISLGNLADYYLVLTGPKTQPTSSRGSSRPIVISNIFLFKMIELIKELRGREIKIGIATSVAKKYWEEAEIYPRQNNSDLLLSRVQREQLGYFI